MGIRYLTAFNLAVGIIAGIMFLDRELKNQEDDNMSKKDIADQDYSGLSTIMMKTVRR